MRDVTSPAPWCATPAEVGAKRRRVRPTTAVMVTRRLALWLEVSLNSKPLTITACNFRLSADRLATSGRVSAPRVIWYVRVISWLPPPESLT